MPTKSLLKSSKCILLPCGNLTQLLNMAHFFVDYPIKNGGNFHSDVAVYQKAIDMSMMSLLLSRICESKLISGCFTQQAYGLGFFNSLFTRDVHDPGPDFSPNIHDQSGNIIKYMLINTHMYTNPMNIYIYISMCVCWCVGVSYIYV